MLSHKQAIILEEVEITLQEAKDFDGHPFYVPDNFSQDFQEKYQLLLSKKKLIETSDFFKRLKISIQPSQDSKQGKLFLLTYVEADLFSGLDSINELKKQYLEAKKEGEIQVAQCIKIQSSKEVILPNIDDVRKIRALETTFGKNAVAAVKEYKDLSEKHGNHVDKQLEDIKLKEFTRAKKYVTNHPSEVEFMVKAVKKNSGNKNIAEISILNNETGLPNLSIFLRQDNDCLIFFMAQEFNVIGWLSFADLNALKSSKLTCATLLDYSHYRFPELEKSNSKVQQAIFEFFNRFEIQNDFELQSHSEG